MKKRPPDQGPVRCAVYTRKSSEEGLEQDFNSLDAQRAAAEAYIQSQKQEGWQCLRRHYDDGGFTGANMDRPALTNLLADIAQGQVDCVLVYKVDRLSRSLLDFARIIETFEKHRVAFVSVTQQFNTATSMGRLVLNVLLSFAQFEREIISERTRDKIAAARRKGKWVGGQPVLGYDVEAHGPRLVVNDEEAVRVRAIFALYLEQQGLTGVVRELELRNWYAVMTPGSCLASPNIPGRLLDHRLFLPLEPDDLGERSVPQRRDRGEAHGVHDGGDRKSVV